MAVVNVSFTIQGEKQVAAALITASNEVSNFRKPLAKANKLLLKTWDQSFSTKGSTIGETWKSRTKSYPWKILQKSGKMRKSFKAKLGGGLLKKTNTTLWNTASYFKYHQSSAPRKSNLPRRVMMKIDRQRQAEIFRFFTKHLNEIGDRWGK